MKPAATILIIIWTLVMVQPAFAYFGGKSAYGDCAETSTSKPSCSRIKPSGSSCSKKKTITSGCSKKKCNKSPKPGKKDDCRSNSCNPTLGCSSGNFYFLHHYQISLPSWSELKQKANVMNDNRIVKNLSECWHPPEA